MDLRSLYRIAIAASLAGVNRSTLKSAIARGEVQERKTACGLPLVDLAEVIEWAAKERKRGPKPAGELRPNGRRKK